jgi:WD40 repeat protein
VRAVAVSPDGRWLAAGADDVRVHLWPLPEGLDGTSASALLGAIGPKLLTLAFDATGERLATGDMDGRLRPWDLGAELPEPITLEQAGGRVLAVGFDARGARLAATTLHGLRLWDLSGADAPRPLLSGKGHGERVTAVAASPDARLIASGDGDGGLLLWDAASGRELARLPAGDAAISALTFAGDGARLASGDGDGTVRVWDSSAGAERASLRTTLPGNGRVAALAFTDADTRLVIASGSGAARALDLADGTAHTLAPYASQVDVLAMDRGGRLLALGIEDEVLGLVDLAEDARSPDAPPRPALPSIGGPFKALAIRDDGRLLAAAMQDGYVRLLDADCGAERARLAGAGDKLASLVFTADGSGLIGGRLAGLLPGLRCALRGQVRRPARRRHPCRQRHHLPGNPRRGLPVLVQHRRRHPGGLLRRGQIPTGLRQGRRQSLHDPLTGAFLPPAGTERDRVTSRGARRLHEVSPATKGCFG